MKRQRLSRQLWIEAGLKALAEKGPSALAAEPLARTLGTTKGSFYWHFKDVPDLQRHVIKAWQAHALAQVVDALEQEGSAEERLRQFGRLVLTSKNDKAIRSWAHSDRSVAKSVALVDSERLKYITSLMRQMGLANEGFARSCLAALIGLPELSGKTAAIKSFDTMIDVILALN